MSYEFGSHRNGYFHDQVAYAAEDLAHGRDALTREWAAFFEAFGPIALAICASEAFDSGPERPILATIQHLPAVRDALRRIEEFVVPHQLVAEEAVRRALAEGGE